MSLPKNKNARAPPSEPSALLQTVIARLGPLVAEHQSFRGDDCIHVARESILKLRARSATPPSLLRPAARLTCVDYFGQPDGFQKPQTWDRNHNWCASVPSGAIA